MTALLDVNVLIALGWPNHEHHGAAWQWFDRSAAQGWATTPATEVRFVRISSNRRAMQVSTTPTAAIDLLAELTALPGHTFWTDDVRLVVGTDGDRRVSSHRLVTDGHLIALASRYRSRLVTFDRALAEHAPAGVVQVL